MKDLKELKAKSYPIPYRYKEQVNKDIQNMFDLNIIERADTKYINPIVIVPKLNGEIRICLDARNINQCTVPQYEAPLSIDAVLGRITEAKILGRLI